MSGFEVTSLLHSIAFICIGVFLWALLKRIAMLEHRIWIIEQAQHRRAYNQRIAEQGGDLPS